MHSIMKNTLMINKLKCQNKMLIHFFEFKTLYTCLISCINQNIEHRLLCLLLQNRYFTASVKIN